MANRFEAKIKLGNMKAAPLTHTGFRGRALKKGDGFTTTNPEEAAYYRAQPGFSVTVTQGKLTGGKPVKAAPVDEDEVDEDDDEDRDEEVGGTYEKADLKKMKVDDLKALIENDEDLPLSVKDLPKKAGKKEIIEAILEAQSGGEESDGDEGDDDEEGSDDDEESDEEEDDDED